MNSHPAKILFVLRDSMSSVFPVVFPTEFAVARTLVSQYSGRGTSSQSDVCTEMAGHDPMVQLYHTAPLQRSLGHLTAFLHTSTCHGTYSVDLEGLCSPGSFQFQDICFYSSYFLLFSSCL